MTSTATVKTTVHMERNTRVRINVAEEGTGLAYVTLATGDLTFALAISGQALDTLIDDLTAIQANARAAEPLVLELQPAGPAHRLDDVIRRIA